METLSLRLQCSVEDGPYPPAGHLRFSLPLELQLHSFLAKPEQSEVSKICPSPPPAFYHCTFAPPLPLVWGSLLSPSSPSLTQIPTEEPVSAPTEVSCWSGSCLWSSSVGRPLTRYLTSKAGEVLRGLSESLEEKRNLEPYSFVNNLAL